MGFLFFQRLFILHGPVKLGTGTRTNPLPMALCPPVSEPPLPRFLFPLLCPSSSYVEPTQVWLFPRFSACNNTITLYCRLHTRIPWGGPVDFTVSAQVNCHLRGPCCFALFFVTVCLSRGYRDTQSQSVSRSFCSSKSQHGSFFDIPWFFLCSSNKKNNKKMHE